MMSVDMCWDNPHQSSGPFTAVFIEGISKPNDCGVRFVADLLQDEFKFPTINVVNVAYFGDGLSELIVPPSNSTLLTIYIPR